MGGEEEGDRSKRIGVTSRACIPLGECRCPCRVSLLVLLAGLCERVALRLCGLPWPAAVAALSGVRWLK
eukprot:scaffold4648_cov148-Isochrysis_galbana.AAC.1